MIEKAIEAFARGFSFTRSFTHPYLAERIGPLWVMRDEPCERCRYRNEEWVAHGVMPEEVDRLVRRHARGRFAVCAINGAGKSDAPLRDGYKALGYRLITTEPVMIQRLRRIPRFEPPNGITIQRVTDRELADRLAKAARRRQILPEHLVKDAPMRQYVAISGGELVGWVRSIVAGKSTWCSNMYVQPAFRRRGIGKAMLCRMLRDDRNNGSKLAVLAASHTGALLYPLVGYEQIAMLLMFAPKRR